MGGRGGSSHRGGGGGFGRGHLAEWTDNESALRQIMRDTGLPEAAARQVQQDMIRYFGADYGSFTNGSLPVETQRITDALLKMPYYNAGPIYRGIHVPNAVADRFFAGLSGGNRAQLRHPAVVLQPGGRCREFWRVERRIWPHDEHQVCPAGQ